jgi:protein-S-isoprenylcysteine O-methyltransferase Ste14
MSGMEGRFRGSGQPGLFALTGFENMPWKMIPIIRATIAFLALPTVIAGLVPTLVVRDATPNQGTLFAGIALLGAGSFLLLWCVRDFFVSGKGTLAPWDPPKHLVVVGLYHYLRNPMYLSVLTVVAGWSLLYASTSLAIYLAFLAVAFHLRVILHEEPWLHRQFGVEWEAYSAAVSRWLPRLRSKTK